MCVQQQNNITLLFPTAWGSEMTDHLSSQEHAAPDDGPNIRSIVYILAKSSTRDVAYFHASSKQFFVAVNADFPEDMEPGRLYSLHWASSGQGVFSHLTTHVLSTYLNRPRWTHSGPFYTSVLIPSLLLGEIVRNYRRFSARIKSLEPLVIALPPRPGLPEVLSSAQFITEAGQFLEVHVDHVVETPKDLELHCSPINASIRGFLKNSRLLYHCKKRELTPVTQVLEEVYRRCRSIKYRALIDCLYGPKDSIIYGRVDTTLVTMRTINGTMITFNATQSEAIRTYLYTDYPALGVIGCPGSGKSLICAAMAVSYCSNGLPGLQVLIGPNLFSLRPLEHALTVFDTANIKILRLEEWGELGRSPFSIMNVDDKENNPWVHVLSQLKEELARACDELARRDVRDRIRDAYARALAALGPQDVIIGTVDAILTALRGMNTKTAIAMQLKFEVARVLIDESNQISEADLNALIHSFESEPMFACVGDPHQLEPHGCRKNDVPTILAGCSALEVLMRKRNVPIVKLTETHRHEASLMPYRPFYGDELAPHSNEEDDEEMDIPLEDDPSRCLSTITEPDSWEAVPSGDGWINDWEVNALVVIVYELRMQGIDHHSVLVLTFYEEQRQLAKAHLPEGYEVLIVDEAQGRESDVVIVLTTHDDVSIRSLTEEDAFFCERRIVVATSRHRERLITIGREDLLASTEPWIRVFPVRTLNRPRYEAANVAKEDDDEDEVLLLQEEAIGN